MAPVCRMRRSWSWPRRQAMPTGDGRAGELRAATYGRGIWQIPLLTASTAAQPSMSLNPASLTFGCRRSRRRARHKPSRLQIPAVLLLTVSSVVTTGDFSETDNCIGSSDCGELELHDPGPLSADGDGKPQRIAYRLWECRGRSGDCRALRHWQPCGGYRSQSDYAELSFDDDQCHQPAQNITISNTGGTSVALQKPTVSGADFAITANTCGADPWPQHRLHGLDSLHSHASGARSGTFSITDDAGTQTASLSGIGTSPATDALAPLALTFAAQQLNTASAAQQVTLTNSGDAL